MKKWLVILTLVFLLTGCDKKQETDAKEESPKQTSVESVEEVTEETEEVNASEESSEPVGESTEATEEVEESVESTETTENAEVTEEETLSQEGLQKVEFYFPNSDVEEIPEELLAGMSAGNLWVARNEIYARHGMIFGVEDLDNYFNSKSWYEPKYKGGSFYDEVEMTMVEEKNVNTILSVEQSR